MVLFARKSYRTIAVPDELYHAVQALLPAKARSVQGYILFWARVGTIVDALIDEEASVAVIADAIRTLADENQRLGGKR